jgi:hypothetical protein
MTLAYDRSADVLYITFASSKAAARYVETEHGQILRISKRTGKLLSCTIPMFSRRASEGTLVIPEIGLAIPTKELGALLKRAS